MLIAMSDASTERFRYERAYCQLRQQQVWAICTRQPDGTWRTANCLDKDQPCFDSPCAFTTDHGTWPFAPAI